MSGGLSSLSDDELMRQLSAARTAAGSPGSAASAPAGLQALSDDELMRQLTAARAGQSGGAVATRQNPFEGGAASFDDRFGTGGAMARTPDTSNPMYEGLRAKADEQLVGKPGAANAAAAFTLRAGNSLALNLPRNIAAGISAVVSDDTGSSYWDRYGRKYELAKEQEAALERQHGRAALAGDVAGITAGAIALPGIKGGASLVGRAVRGAATGALYGAGSEFADSHDLGNAAGAAGIGAVAGGAGTYAFEKLAPVATKGAKALYGLVSGGKPVVNETGELTTTALAMLRREGVAPETLTPEVRAGIGRAVARKGESEAALREALGEEFGIPLSRGQATGDAAALALEDAARAGQRGERARGVASGFDQRQAEAIEAAGARFADRAGRGVTQDHPQQASEILSDQLRERSRRAGFEADDAQRRADEALAGLRGGFQGDPLDAADAVRQGVRGAARERKAAYGAAYDEVAQIPGEFAPGALDRIGTTVRGRLGADVPIDPVLTPASSRALADLDNLPSLFNVAPGTGPTLRQAEDVRKRIGSLFASTAQNPTDRRALGAILDEYDRHVSDAVEAGLFGARPSPNSAADGFPGFSGGAGASDALAGAGGRPGAIGGDVAARAAPERKAESLLQFLGRRGGIALDGDARAADYGRIQTGFGPLGRKNGRPIEDFRDELAAEGFIRPDDDAGMISRKIGDELHDLIGMERRGDRVYRLEDISGGAGLRDVTGRVAGESAAAAERFQATSQQLVTELEAVGIRPRDIDPETLREATNLMSRGKFSDATEAYEAAVLAREPSVRGSVAQDVPFDGPTALAASDALPGAVPDVVDKMRKARSLFSAYKRDFAPQGAGDDVGRAMRRIVDREAEPVEVARILYKGNPGLNMRVADRIKGVVGADSDAWAAHRQGYLASILNGRDMSTRAVAERIGAALGGEGRGLTYKVLSDAQVKGLRDAQEALRAAGRAREGIPEWVTALGRTDFDANRITADLFGSGVPGARSGAAANAGALKKMLGEESAEWSGLRLAAWQRLAMKPDGSGMLPAKHLAQRIREFTDGGGSGLAKQLFEPELLAQMRRYGNSVQATVRADGTPLPNGGGKAGKIAGYALDAILATLAFKVAGFAGAGAAITARAGSKHIQGGLAARSVRQSFEGGAPVLREVPPDMSRGRLGVGAGLYAGAGAE